MVRTPRPAGGGSPWAAALLGLLSAAAMAVLARGMAGDEEPAHFLIARYAFEEPSLFLSLAGRPLVTLILALPAQAGFLAARLAGAVAVAACAWALARTARSAGLGSPLAVTLFLLLQPFFLAHAGTAMTEPWAAALVAAMIFAYTERRGRLLALLAALAPLVRMEIAAFWPLVAVVLWREGPRRWLTVLPLPLLALNGCGALVSGDPLWLLHQSRWQAYPEREPLHYLKSLVWVAGLGLFPAVVTGFVRGVLPWLGWGGEAPGTPKGAAEAEVRERALRAATVAALVLLAVYSALAWWHPITYGNLRYLAYAAPPFALLAAAGLERPFSSRPRAELAGPGLALCGAAFLWDHAVFRDFAFLTRRDWLPLAAALLWLLGFLARATVARPPRTERWALPLVAAILVLANGADLLLRHRESLHLAPLPEHAAVARAARLLPDPLPPGTRLVAAHPVLALERGRNPYDAGDWPPVTDRLTAAAAPGTVLFWDTHYVAGKYPALELLAILQSKAWRYGAGVISSDSTWAGAYFVRSGPGDEALLAGLGRGLEEKSWIAGARLVQYGIPSGVQNVTADPENDEYWRILALRLFTAGFYPAAVGALDQAERMDPDDARNPAYRAEFHRQRKEFADAAEAASRALARAPGDPTFKYLMGRIFLDQGRPEQAEPYLIAAARGLEKRWDVQFDAGGVLLDLKRWDEARPFFEAALLLNPNEWRAVRRLAEIDWRLDRREAALGRVREFLLRRPEMAAPHALLGDFLLAMDRREEARAAWEEGMKKAGGDPEIASRLASLSAPAEP